MKLTDLLAEWVANPIPDCDILGLKNDSRRVKPGDLFFAYPGAIADGRLYIQQAFNAGALAVVYEPEALPSSFSKHASCVPVPQLKKNLAAIASRFYNYPARGLSITGVTGTNGKTIIAHQLAQAHELLGTRAAYVGTLGHGKVNRLQDLSNTTPDALCLQQLLHGYKQKGLQQVCMEVSSHALSQGRIDCVDFTQAIYTNLSHEHLDYHHTMQEYATVKAALFAIPTLNYVVINQDDAYGQFIGDHVPLRCKKLTYGMHGKGDVRALNWHISMTGSQMDVSSPWGTHQVVINTVGVFNIYNSLAVLTSLLVNGYPPSEVIQVMSKLRASPGRMEVVAQEPCVIVDYAHTPDALENVLSTVVQLKQGRVWVVFGCGGNRDKTKRPIMGRIASEYADFVILTNDNPRFEMPTLIIDDIAEGLLSKTNALKITDRKNAIHKALSLADKRDIILIAGKGHESYQQIGNERYTFSDQEVVRQLLGKTYPKGL